MKSSTTDLPADEHGAPDSRLEFSPWQVPDQMTLRGDVLTWQFSDELSKWKSSRPGPHMFEEFLALATAPNGVILDYASKWGVLSLCQHNLPATHPEHMAGYPAMMRSECRSPRWMSMPNPEPIETWRHFARQMRALVLVAGNLRAKMSGRREDWLQVYEWAPEDFRTRISNRTDWDRTINGQFGLVWMVVNELLMIAQVEPRFGWSTRGPELTLFSGSLFGALTLQMCLAICGAKGLAMCSGCSVAYPPKRWPRDGELHFCQVCRNGKVAQKLASRRYLAKLKAAPKSPARTTRRGVKPKAAVGKRRRQIPLNSPD